MSQSVIMHNSGELSSKIHYIMQFFEMLIYFFNSNQYICQNICIGNIRQKLTDKIRCNVANSTPDIRPGRKVIVTSVCSTKSRISGNCAQKIRN